MIVSSIHSTTVATYGFRSGYSCDDITSIMRQTICFSHHWGVYLVVGTLDIAVAFDSVDRQVMADILSRRGLHPNLVRAIMREVSFMKCNISLPGVDACDRFDMQTGGKQGGVETPTLFNAMIDSILLPVVKSWRQRSMGFSFGDEDERPLSHLIWADNVILFAKSIVEFNQMAQDLTNAIYAAGFQWKLSSLECILCGGVTADSSNLGIQNPFAMPFKVVD